MNYIKEINSFYDWILYNPLPTGAIALWNALMSINNKAGWADEFTVANIVLQGITGLSRQGLDKSRNTLVQKGLVEYKKGTSNQAGKYKMIKFDSQKVGTVVDTVVVTEDSGETLECKKVDTVIGTKACTELSQEGHNSSTLNKLNKTKQNDINNNNNNNNAEQEKNIDIEFLELAKLYQSCIGQPNGLTAGWIESLKSEFGFEWVKNAMLEAEGQGVRTKAYVTKILNNWKTWGGMKLSTDKANTKSKGVPAAAKTRFHNFEQRSDKYSKDEIDSKVENIALRKRREYLERNKGNASL